MFCGYLMKLWFAEGGFEGGMRSNLNEARNGHMILPPIDVTNVTVSLPHIMWAGKDATYWPGHTIRVQLQEQPGLMSLCSMFTCN